MLALAAVAAVAAAAVAVSAASPQQANTVMIGWAYDGNGAMAPFDGPALATARDRVRQVNRGQRREPADHDVQHAGEQAGDRQGVRGQAARPGRGRHLHDVRRRLRGAGRAGVDQRRASSRSRRASARTRWGRSASGPRDASRSRSGTSRRTRARRWRSTRGGAAGVTRRSRRTRSSSTSATSSRRSRRAGASSAATSSPRSRTSRSAATRRRGRTSSPG